MKVSGLFDHQACIIVIFCHIHSYPLFDILKHIEFEILFSLKIFNIIRLIRFIGMSEGICRIGIHPA